MVLIQRCLIKIKVRSVPPPPEPGGDAAGRFGGQVRLLVSFYADARGDEGQSGRDSWMELWRNSLREKNCRLSSAEIEGTTLMA